MRCYIVIGVAIALVTPVTGTFAHGGGLAADGCHNDRKNGGRHCHKGGGKSPAPKQRLSETQGSFTNCTAARAAGAAPVYAGQPGYGRHLDRDGDGVGCE